MPSLREAHILHVRHYLSLLQAIRDVTERGGQNTRPAEIFDLEWPNINAAHNWADQHKEKDIEALEYCYYFAMHGIHIKFGDSFEDLDEDEVKRYDALEELVNPMLIDPHDMRKRVFREEE